MSATRLNDAAPIEWDRASRKQIGGTHYKEMAIQPLEFILANKLGYCEANAVKYICRHTAKGGKQDIEKAIHYLELLMDTYEDAHNE